MNTLFNRPTGRLLRIRNRLALAAMEHKYRRILLESHAQVVVCPYWNVTEVVSRD